MWKTWLIFCLLSRRERDVLHIKVYSTGDFFNVFDGMEDTQFATLYELLSFYWKAKSPQDLLVEKGGKTLHLLAPVLNNYEPSINDRWAICTWFLIKWLDGIVVNMKRNSHLFLFLILQQMLACDQFFPFLFHALCFTLFHSNHFFPTSFVRFLSVSVDLSLVVCFLVLPIYCLVWQSLEKRHL